MELTLRSPAKVNLFLKVLSKRSDGFHELASLFQAISLFDCIYFRISDRDEFSCSDGRLPQDSSNLVVKAVHLFRLKTGIITPLKIHLTKHIPCEAGLGGGSGNAATTLWGMNELFGRTVAPEQLKAWSAEIGSDIPFFLSHGTAYCTGRGEVVREHDPLGQTNIWIIKPPFGLATPQVYKALTLPELSKHDPLELLHGFKAGSPRLVNDLETPAFQLMPALAAIKKRYKNILMSGSGTSFFSFENLETDCPQEYFCAKASFINRSSASWY